MAVYYFSALGNSAGIPFLHWWPIRKQQLTIVYYFFQNLEIEVCFVACVRFCKSVAECVHCAYIRFLYMCIYVSFSQKPARRPYCARWFFRLKNCEISTSRNFLFVSFLYGEFQVRFRKKLRFASDFETRECKYNMKFFNDLQKYSHFIYRLYIIVIKCERLQFCDNVNIDFNISPCVYLKKYVCNNFRKIFYCTICISPYFFIVPFEVFNIKIIPYKIFSIIEFHIYLMDT